MIIEYKLKADNNQGNITSTTTSEAGVDGNASPKQYACELVLTINNNGKLDLMILSYIATNIGDYAVGAIFKFATPTELAISHNIFKNNANTNKDKTEDLAKHLNKRRAQNFRARAVLYAARKHYKNNINVTIYPNDPVLMQELEKVEFVNAPKIWQIEFVDQETLNSAIKLNLIPEGINPTVRKPVKDKTEDYNFNKENQTYGSYTPPASTPQSIP